MTRPDLEIVGDQHAADTAVEAVGWQPISAVRYRL